MPTTPQPDAAKMTPTDAELFAKARKHMEQWSVAASLARPLWDATVREHARLLAENAALVKALERAIGLVEGLADQQAMDDDWFREPLAELKSALALHQSGNRSQTK